LLALFNGLLVGVTSWLVWATIGLRKSAEDVFYATDRPWVGSVTVGNNPPKIDHPLDAWVIIQNTGRSPARETEGQCRRSHVAIRQSTDAPKCYYIPPKALFALIPDHHPADFGQVPLTQADALALQQGSIIVWVIGRVEYLDARNVLHHTNICTRWDRTRGQVRLLLDKRVEVAVTFALTTGAVRSA
jgi:hypothetical protein